MVVWASPPVMVPSLVDISRDNTSNLTNAKTCMCVLCVPMHGSMCLKQYLIFLVLALSRRRPYTYRRRHTHTRTNIHTPTPLHQFTCSLTHALLCGILLGAGGCVQGSPSRSRCNTSKTRNNHCNTSETRNSRCNTSSAPSKCSHLCLRVPPYPHALRTCVYHPLHRDAPPCC